MKNYPNESFWGRKVMSTGYVSIPNLLLRANRKLPESLKLKPVDNLILIHLLSHAHELDKRSISFPTQEQLAVYLNCTRNTVSSSIDRLVKQGWITKKKHKRYHRWEYDLFPTKSRFKALVGDFSDAREVTSNDCNGAEWEKFQSEDEDNCLEDEIPF